MNVIKRDGKVVTYDIHRIHSAILNAMRDVQDVDFDMVNILTDLVESQIHQEDTITVEKIQDTVEDVLSKHAPAVYKHFHEYRAERTRIRESKSPVSKMIDELVNTDSNDSDLKRENANVNTDSTMGTMLKVGSEICRKQFLDKYMRPRHAAKHREGYYHIHDMDLGLLTVNCIYIPLGKLLDRGFNTGHGYIRPPKTVSSAASLACIILQSNQNEMYGGQAFACFEYALAKYVAKSYVRHVLGICQILHDLSDDIVKPVIDRLDDYVIKHTHIMRTEEGLKVVDGELNSLGISTSEHFDKIIPIAYKKTVEETKQAMEALVYNFNTMHARSGAQVPFSSLNYGTDTSTEGRIVISAILDAIDAGLGTGETALFPISIFRMKKGITDKGSPNYDLFKKACRVSARRLYPNFLSLDSSFNLPYYHEGHPETYAAAMGCSDGTGVITIRHENDYPFSICFEDFVKLKDNTAYKVWDSHAGKFVKINKVIANPPTDKWIEFTFSNGKILTLTPDHYLPINGVRTRVDNAKIGDAVPVGEYPTFSMNNNYSNYKTDWFWLLGIIIRDGSYRNPVVVSVGIDEMDLAITVQQAFKFAGYLATLKYQNRGIKGQYIDIIAHKSKIICTFLNESFGAHPKCDRTIPKSIFSASYSCRMAFLCGMIDADGYVRSRHGLSMIEIGSTNKKLSLQTYMLAQSLNLSVKIRRQHYGRGDDSIRYNVYIQPNEYITSYLVSAKKRLKITCRRNVSQMSKPSIAVITKIEHKLMVKPSYCLETETDMFDLNGMQSHNCRTRVLGNDYDPKQQITEGRGNLFSVTLSLPFLALLAKENLTKISSKFTKEELISEFMKLVTDNVNDIFTEMDDRFEMICKRKVKNYPFLMGQDIYLGSGKLSYEDSIRSSLMHGTRTVGFIGLAECLTALIGKHHGESEEAQKLGLKIVKHMYDMCKYRSEKLHINYSLMGSPAEGCTGRLAKCAAKRFGVIPGVTDKKYFTNSSHVPPRYHISAYDKVKVEAPYHKYELAGAISYIEYPGDPAKNVKAFEELVTYMANSDMGYFSINHPVMHDPVCGYTGAPNPDGTCPNCGRKPGEGMPAWKLSRVQKLATTDIKYRINARDLI